MSNIITVGKRLIPSEHIVLIEPFDPKANPNFQTSRDYKGRVVLLNRDSILIEETPKAFAEANGMRILADDGVATNPAIHFSVETFTPAENFVPTRAYATRLLWRDLDGNDQSKLLLSLPETVLAVAVRGETDVAADVRPDRSGRRGQVPARVAATP